MCYISYFLIKLFFVCGTVRTQLRIYNISGLPPPVSLVSGPSSMSSWKSDVPCNVPAFVMCNRKFQLNSLFIQKFSVSTVISFNNQLSFMPSLYWHGGGRVRMVVEI